MGMHIAICDDSGTDREYVEEMVQRWIRTRGRTARVCQYSSAENFLFRAPEDGGADILLLDIEMGAMDGVTLAKRLRQSNETMQIVFITGYSDYIAEGYEVSALHYLMKPVNEQKLFSVLDRAAERLQRDEKLLRLELSGETVCIPIYSVRYADVQGNYVSIHADRAYTAKMTLRELESSLDNRFYRVGRSAIVNLTRIARVTRMEITLSDGSAIPLPRGAYEGVNRAIINME